MNHHNAGPGFNKTILKKQYQNHITQCSLTKYEKYEPNFLYPTQSGIDETKKHSKDDKLKEHDNLQKKAKIKNMDLDSVKLG